MTSILPVRLLLAAVAGLYIVLIAIVSAPLAHAQGRGGSALIARALTLYNIVSFVHWPEELFRASEGDLVVSIIGDARARGHAGGERRASCRRGPQSDL